MRTPWLLLAALIGGCGQNGTFGQLSATGGSGGGVFTTGGTSGSGAGSAGGSSTGSTGSASTGSSSGSTGSGSTGSGSGASSGSGSASGSAGSGSGSTGGMQAPDAGGSTGSADAGVYSYSVPNNTYWCQLYLDGGLVSLPADDAGCLGEVPACAGQPLPLEPEVHVPEPMQVAYHQEPPPDGPHWACWAPWDQSHAFDALPAERFLHNSEHSGVVLLYACDPDAGLPDGGSCDALVDPLLSWVADGGPAVPVAGDRRYLITARPGMAHAYTAIGWGWRLEFDDFDAGLLDCFAAAHLGAGPENTGVDPGQAGCPQSYAP